MHGGDLTGHTQHHSNKIMSVLANIMVDTVQDICDQIMLDDIFQAQLGGYRTG